MTATLLQFPSNRFLPEDLFEVLRWCTDALRYGWFVQTVPQPNSSVEELVAEDETGAQFLLLTYGHSRAEARRRVERRGRHWIVRDLTADGMESTTHESLRAALASVLPSSRK